MIHDVANSESRWNQDFYGLAHELIGRRASQDSDLFAGVSNPTIFVDDNDLVRQHLEQTAPGVRKIQ